MTACADPNAAPIRKAPARVADGRGGSLADAAKASIDNASASRMTVVASDRIQNAISELALDFRPHPAQTISAQSRSCGTSSPGNSPR